MVKNPGDLPQEEIRSLGDRGRGLSGFPIVAFDETAKLLLTSDGAMGLRHECLV